MVGMLDDWSGSPYADMGGPDPAILALLQRQFGGGRAPGTTPGGAMGATNAPAPLDSVPGMLSGLAPKYVPYASPVDEAGFAGMAEPQAPMAPPVAQPAPNSLPGGFNLAPMSAQAPPPAFGSLSPEMMTPPAPAPVVPTTTPLDANGRPVGEVTTMPPGASPTAGRGDEMARVIQAAAAPSNKSISETSLLGRLGQVLGNNSNTLLQMGAGIASSANWHEALGRGFAGAAHGRKADEANAQKSATVEALRRRGLSESTARLAVNNPEVMKSVVAQLFDGRKGVVINDRLVDPTTGRVIADFSDLSRKAPQTVQVKNADDTETTMQWDYKAQAWTPVGTPGGQGPANPYSLGGKTTEAQAKDAVYANRAHESERTMRDPAVMAVAPRIDLKMLNALPGVGNYFVPPEYQKFVQAQRNFINAALRRESGAVISNDEFMNARQQYFPQPGDAPEVLGQKQKNRIDTMTGIATGAGKNWKPPFLFGSKGEIIEHRSPNSTGGGWIDMGNGVRVREKQ